MLRYAVILLLTFTALCSAQSLDQTHIDFHNPLLNGVNCDTLTMNAALNAIGTKQRTLFLSATDRAKVECTWAITSNVTVPENIRLLVPFGVHANISAGVTLTVNGCLDAQDPAWQTGPGTIVQNGVCTGDATAVFGAQWFGFVYDDCLHGTTTGVKATITSCKAFILDSAVPKLISAVVSAPVEITYTGGDGRFWLLLRDSIASAVTGWTCVPDTLYCWIKSATRPPLPARTLLLMRSDIASSSITQAGDASVRLFNRPVTYTTDATTADESNWIFMPGGSLTYTGVNIVHNGALQSGTVSILRSGGTGTFKVSPKIVIDPAWFVNAGAGSETDPWTSLDNCGGFCEAFSAVPFHGNVRTSPGFYRFASTTPASFDLPVNSADGDITIDLTESVVQLTVNGTFIKLNKNGILADTSTNLNTVHIFGGLITTQLAGVMQNNAPILGIGIDATRLRNLTITRMRFLGLERAILANVADTLDISNNFFRRTRHAVFIENNATPDIPQDIYITKNVASTGDAPETPGILSGSTFVTIENRVDHVTIAQNGIANGTENSRFVRILTGDEAGNSSNIVIDDNATEQFAAGSKLVEIIRFGTTVITNVTITRNSFSGIQGLEVPPFANGQPALDLSYIAGHLRIADNHFTNSSVTAIRLDYFVPMNEANPPSASGYIENNTFEQIVGNNGTPFNITNVLGNGTRLIIGRNATVPFYGGTFPVITYPDIGVLFQTGPSYTSNIVAAPTITISPWDDYVEINGTTVITNITPTWHGHTVCMLFETTGGGIDRSATLLIESSMRSRIPNESLACLKYDGNLNVWREVSRTTNQMLFDFVAASSATVNSSAAIVNVIGSGTVNTIAVNRNGQQVTFQCQTATGVIFSKNTGNLLIGSNFVCDGAGKTLTLIPNNANWFEVGRNNTPSP